MRYLQKTWNLFWQRHPTLILYQQISQKLYLFTVFPDCFSDHTAHLILTLFFPCHVHILFCYNASQILKSPKMSKHGDHMSWISRASSDFQQNVQVSRMSYHSSLIFTKKNQILIIISPYCTTKLRFRVRLPKYRLFSIQGR